jgi:nucleoside-specific outer membrane channel protein Tsx
MKTLPKKLKTQGILIVLGTLILATPASMALANDAENNELREQQLKLQQILEEIGETREKRVQQRAQLEKLNHKMQCNWTLIQAYDACDEKFKEQKQEQLSCSQQAKEKAKECLSE